MRYWGNTIAGPLGVLVAALLLPGGIPILAWALCRRFSRQSLEEQRIKRSIPLIALLALLQGCATHFNIGAAFRLNDAENASRTPVLQFQRLSIEPRSDEAFVAPEELRPGDILLSSAPTFRSAAIQLVTVAPVSHVAVYIGDGKVVEAVPPAVRVRRVGELLVEEDMVLVLRHPDLTAEQAQSMRAYSLKQVGTGYNSIGVAMHGPFGILRRVCELPLMPSAVRDACIRTVGSVIHVGTSDVQLSCSQLVLQAYRQAGVSITSTDPRLISPADILHMREGDVSSVRIRKQLRYVGYLKYERPVTVAFQQ